MEQQQQQRPLPDIAFPCSKLKWSRAKLAMVLVGCITLIPFLAFEMMEDTSSNPSNSQAMPFLGDSRKSSTTHSHPFQLKVPFYIYDGNLDWSNFTPREPCRDEGPDLYEKTKHSDDYWLLKNAKVHPMRTLDPSQAKLFFVPILLNAWASCTGMYSMNTTFCVNDVCDLELLEQAERTLKDSPWFQRNWGRDHIIVDSDWEKILHWGHKRLRGRKSYLLSCNFISFEGGYPAPRWKKLHGNETKDPRLLLASFYIGTPCPGPFNKTHDFAMVASLSPGRPHFHHRSNVCNWLAAGNYSVAACGKAPRCPAVGGAKYGLHVRGDTFGSQRAMDILLSESIPLFTDPEQYNILPDFVPWRDMTYLININSESNFYQSLNSVLGAGDYQDKLKTLKKYYHILDHTQPFQVDAYLHRFAQLMGLY